MVAGQTEKDGEATGGVKEVVCPEQAATVLWGATTENSRSMEVVRKGAWDDSRDLSIPTFIFLSLPRILSVSF